MNPLITLTEIDLEIFKQWFSDDFIKQLDSLFMCGNYGDPIIAKDCLKIFEYLRSVNPDINLSMHTNGSARDTSWWQQLASINVRTVFGIDGLEDTHHLYRIDTDWNKIIKNAEAFIAAGGTAEWHMLVFKHNEHQVEQCRRMANFLGFSNFQSKHTTRFTDVSFPVLNDDGKLLYKLEPSSETTKRLHTILNYSSNMPETFVVSKIANCRDIECKALKSKQFYVSATGNISPCCWMDLKETLHKQTTRIDYMSKVGEFPNLYDQTLQEIFESGYFGKISSSWQVEPVFECARQCGNFDKSGAQFADRS